MRQHQAYAWTRARAGSHDLGRCEGGGWHSHRENAGDIVPLIITLSKRDASFLLRERRSYPRFLLISAREIGSYNPRGTGARVHHDCSDGVGC